MAVRSDGYRDGTEAESPGFIKWRPHGYSNLTPVNIDSLRRIGNLFSVQSAEIVLANAENREHNLRIKCGDLDVHLGAA
jgi:hypothetical protein